MKITLFKAFPDAYRQSMTVYADHLQTEAAKILSAKETIRTFLPEKINLKPPARYWSQYVSYPRQAARMAGDINHIIDHSYSHLLSRLDPKKTTITFHDAISYKAAVSELRGFRGLRARWANKTNLQNLKNAGRIICDSESGKKDLLRLIAYPEKNISVIPLGVDAPFFEDYAQKKAWEAFGLEEGLYLLHIGHTGFYKNIPALLEVLSRLRRNGLPVRLLRAGTPFTAEQVSRAENLGVRNSIVDLGFIRRDLLPLLYRAASVLLFPSLDEGFGFPVLEAMASGTPVVMSNRGALPELATNSAMLYDPQDYEGMARQVGKLLNHQETRISFIAQGRKKARSYTWELTAKKTLAVYRELAQSNKG